MTPNEAIDWLSVVLLVATILMILASTAALLIGAYDLWKNR